MARRFNLQPWRSELREVKRKEFVVLTSGVVLLIAGLCLGYYVLKNRYLESQQRAISTLDTEIANLEKAEKEIQRIKDLNDEIERQILVIQDLQEKRSLTVEILDYIAMNIPETVFVNSIENKDSSLTIIGTAENEMGVSSFIRQLQKFKKFERVRLVNMEEAESGDRYSVNPETSVRDFTLAVTVSAFKGME